jgi:hypothetical protein
MLDTMLLYMLVDNAFEAYDIQFDHAPDHFIDLVFILCFISGQGKHFFVALFSTHSVYTGYFIPVLIQKSNGKQGAQFFIAVGTDIGSRTGGLQEIVSLFPYTNGMGLYARKGF